MDNQDDHFKGKPVPEHLKEARLKGAKVSEQIHGVELSGWIQAGCDASKETAMYLAILWIVAPQLLPFFAAGLLLWKTGRAAFLGWSRLYRLNQLITEERNEIQNARESEEKELTEIYHAKGFESPLLEQVVQVLMADENRLLTVMLEEELGVKLESYDHPLKQAFGACLGVAITAIILILSTYVSPLLFFGFAAFTFLVTTTVALYPQKHAFIPFNVWALSIGALVFIALYQLHKLFPQLLFQIGSSTRNA